MTEARWSNPAGLLLIGVVALANATLVVEVAS